MNLQLFLFLVYLVHYNVVGGEENESKEHLVTIPSLGQVRGSLMTSAGGRQFLAFRGIPYAKPPIENLRFKDPLPVEPWNGKILDGTKEGPACLQYNAMFKQVLGVEDCLVLNVYTHSTEKSGLKPVMIWIHGGGFMFGSGNGETDAYGPGYILDRDVVLVTINYRLAVLGFLTTGDTEAPGNYGLLDQTLALKWVRDHIGHFGGDPKSVTIFGESAGGASVEAHILSPLSKGLFDRAIIQSGSLTNPWALQQSDVEQYSKLLAEEVKCPLAPSREMVSCLRAKDAKDLLEFIQKRASEPFPSLAFFGPRVDFERDSPFLPDHPKTLVKEKRFNSVPIITGMTQNEGGIILSLLGMEDRKLMKLFVKDPVKYIPSLLDFELHNDAKKIATKINARYFNQEYDYEDQLVEIEQMASDYMFNKGIDDLAHLFSEYSEHPTFYYMYAHKTQLSFFRSISKLMGLPSEIEEFVGVSHGSDVFALFTHPMFPVISDDPLDIKVSKLMLDLWISFATDGVPRSDLLEDEWLPIVKKTRYLKIQAEQPKMIHQSMPFRYRLGFWDSILDSITKKDEL